MDSHCDTSGKCSCINGCWPTCDGEYCSYCGSEDGIKYCTVTITYEVKGECTRDSGKITWNYVGRDE